MRFPRSSGVLLPVFSLPGGSIGDFGSEAFRFIDFLETARQTIWQLLPLGPPAFGDSPYSSYSAFAGNPLLISCDELVKDGLLTFDQAAAARDESMTPERVDYDHARTTKKPLLRAAFNVFRQTQNAQMMKAFDEFCSRNEFWLTDYVRFESLAAEAGDANWSNWDSALVRRDADALAAVDRRLKDAIEIAKFEQFVFARQWKALKTYANERNVRLYGDMPIFVAYESADVWTHQHLFQLDESGRPLVVAGVPPDYFSETGQMWGNPLYRWDALASTNYDWWIRRLRQAFEAFDVLRIDHFRGFESYWEIPAGAENAIGGRWCPGPADAFFSEVKQTLGELPIVAEDLGLITDDVHALRERVGFPGMRVLQFGFTHEHDSYHRPDCFPDHCFAYTGTHDNDTLMGWYHRRHENGVQQHLLDRFLSGSEDRIHWDFIAAVLHSAADSAIVPVQDLLGLGSEARMNTPGEPYGNWHWRCGSDSLSNDVAQRLGEVTEHSHRG